LLTAPAERDEQARRGAARRWRRLTYGQPSARSRPRCGDALRASRDEAGGADGARARRSSAVVGQEGLWLWSSSTRRGAGQNGEALCCGGPARTTPSWSARWPRWCAATADADHDPRRRGSGECRASACAGPVRTAERDDLSADGPGDAETVRRRHAPARVRLERGPADAGVLWAPGKDDSAALGSTTWCATVVHRRPAGAKCRSEEGSWTHVPVAPRRRPPRGTLDHVRASAGCWTTRRRSRRPPPPSHCEERLYGAPECWS